MSETVSTLAAGYDSLGNYTYPTLTLFGVDHVTAG